MNMGKASEEAYDRWLEKQADAYWEPEYVCAWCGCKSENEETCTECGAPVDGSDYYSCPYCGDIKPDASRQCCHEMHIELHTKKGN